MKNRIVVAVGSLAFSGLLFFVWRSHEEILRQGRVEVETQRRVAELERQVQSLGRSDAVAGAIEGIARSAQASDPKMSAAVERSPARVPEPMRDEAPEATKRAQYFSYLDEVLAAERRDVQWDAPRDLAAQIPRLLPSGSRVRSVDCRATICRLETSHRDMAAYDAFMASAFLPAHPPGAVSRALWSGPSMFDVSDDGAEVRAVAYLVRENHDAPIPKEEELVVR